MSAADEGPIDITIFTCKKCGTEMPDVSIYRDFHECPEESAVLGKDVE